jgi:hypothetical protein
VGGTQVGAVAKLEYRGDQIDGQGDTQFHRVVQINPVNVTYEEPKVQRAGKNDEETKDNLFEIHGASIRTGKAPRTWRARLSDVVSLRRFLTFRAQSPSCWWAGRVVATRLRYPAKAYPSIQVKKTAYQAFVMVLTHKHG